MAWSILGQFLKVDTLRHTSVYCFSSPCPFAAVLLAGWMESTPLLLQWLATTSPPTFLPVSKTSWCFLGSVVLLLLQFPQAHAYPAMLSLALKVLPITNTYIALQPPPCTRAANSSSSRSSFEAMRLAATRCMVMFSTGLLNLKSCFAPMPAEADGLRMQLLVGPGTEPALLQLTAACRSLHSQHTAKQRKCRRSADMGMAGASSRRHSRSSKPRGESSSSCSSTSQSSNRVAGQSAKEEAASLLLPPDHQLMEAQCGERSVAAIEAFMRSAASPVEFYKHIGWCVDVLGESAVARWEQRQSTEMLHIPESTPAALHASAQLFCLGSAAGLQLLLEALGLLIAEGNHTGPLLHSVYRLLISSILHVTKAERRVFLAARGGLLVQVLQLGLQADWEGQQQQLEGVMEVGKKGAMVFCVWQVVSMLVADSPAVATHGETGEVLLPSAPIHYLTVFHQCSVVSHSHTPCFTVGVNGTLVEWKYQKFDRQAEKQSG